MPNSGRVRGNRGGLAVASALAGLMLVGCATGNLAPPPTAAQMAGAERNVKAARDVGANNDPKAAPLLRSAEENLSTAKDRAAAGDNLGATLLLARAEADAELGHMLARQARAKAELALTERQLEETRASQPGTPAAAPAAAPGAPLSPPAPAPASSTAPTTPPTTP